MNWLARRWVAKRQREKKAYAWDWDPNHCPECGGSLRSGFMGMLECQKCGTGFLGRELRYMARNKTMSINGLYGW